MSLFDRFFVKLSNSKTAPIRSRRLQLESLENRELLSVSSYDPDVLEYKPDTVIQQLDAPCSIALVNSDNIAAAETADGYTGDLRFNNTNNTPFVATTKDATAAATTITADDLIYLNFNVFADGVATSPIVWYFTNAHIYIDDTFAQSTSVSFTPGYHVQQRNILLSSLVAGEHSIKIILDPSNFITETNENNNETTISITVLESELGPVSQPANIQAVINNGRVKLTWTGPNDATRYEIRRKDVDGIHWTVLGNQIGTTFYDVNPPDGQQYYEIRTFRDNAVSVAGAVNLYVAPGTSRVPRLSSLEGAAKTIFLDFDGNNTITTLAADQSRGPQVLNLDSDDTSFNVVEIKAIHDVWAYVAELFSPFDVNVTTVDPGIDGLARTNTQDDVYGVRVSFGAVNGSGTAIGLAYLGTFDSTSGSSITGTGLGTDALVDVNAIYGNGSSKSWRTFITDFGQCIAHEVGHNLGLDHDGSTTINGEYYWGHDISSSGVRWNTIMGGDSSTPNKTIEQWSKGDYIGATLDVGQTDPDDLKVITSNGFGYRADEETMPLVFSSDTVTASGIIATTDDFDDFVFTVYSSAYYLFDVKAGTAINNEQFSALYFYADLFKGNERVVHNLASISTLTTSISLLLDAGEYTLRIGGTGFQEGSYQGFTSYGSLGTYTISGSLEYVTPAVPADFQEKTNTASPNTVTLQWTQSPNAAGYDIRYKNTAEIGNDVWILVPCNNSTKTTITGLESDTEYTFQIRAVNGSKVSLWSDTITAATAAAETPLGIPQVNISQSNGNVTLSWAAIPTATHYGVYRMVNGKWTVVNTNVTATTFTENSVPAGIQTYAVRAFKGTVMSEYQQGVTITILGVPQVNISQSNGNVTLNWTAIIGADHYGIYRLVNGKWTSLGYVTKTTFTDNAAPEGLQTYAVRAFKGTVMSEYQQGVTITILGVPQVNISQSNGNVTLNWAAIPTATHYGVYRMVNGKWTVVNANVTATTFTENNVPEGLQTYAVRVFKGTVYSDYQPGVTINVVAGLGIPQVTPTQANGKVTLSWAAIAGADRYCVYRLVNGKWTSLGYVTTTTFTEPTALTGLQTYAVRAFKGTVMSDYQNGVTITILGVPQVTPTKSNGKVTLNWAAITGADRYCVYRLVNGKWTSLGYITATMFTESTVLTGLQTYAVRAFKGTTMSEYQQGVTITV